MHWRKTWIALLILAVLIAAFFPWIASIGFGKKMVERAIEAKLHGPVEIEDLRLSWLGPQKVRGVRFSLPAAEGSIESLEFPVPLWSMGNTEFFSIKNGSLSFPTGSVKQVNGSIEGRRFDLTGITQTEEGAAGHVAAKGRYVSNTEFDIALDLKNVPSSVLDLIEGTNGFALSILGPSFDLAGTISNPGPVDLNLSSENGKGTVKGRLDGRVFTLKEPLALSFFLTQDLSESLLKDVNPLFLTGLQSKGPIALAISNQGFVLPLFPFSWNEFRIGQASIDMGQIRCSIGKSFAAIIALLKASPFSKAREIDAWFTPLAFSLENGVLHTGRMDALLGGSLHVCTWGDIDLAHNRLHMFLGIPADTLSRSFGIKNLPQSFVLRVPITGSTQDPDLEVGPAAAKIAAMIAGEHIPKKGKSFSDLINQFIHSAEGKNVPPPNLPFPWQQDWQQNRQQKKSGS